MDYNSGSNRVVISNRPRASRSSDVEITRVRNKAVEHERSEGKTRDEIVELYFRRDVRRSLQNKRARYYVECKC